MALDVRPIIPSRFFGQKPRGTASTSRIGAYIALMKLRVVELLLVTTVPTMVLADGGWPSIQLMAVTLICGTLAAGGANAINMYIDRDIDKLMVRTQNRPLVTGVLTPKAAMMFAIVLEIVAFCVLWAGANLLAAVLAVSATLFYVFVYSLWLKRTSRQNIVIGGAAGAMPVLVGWAAVTNSLGWAPIVLFIVIFLWTPPHFWALAIRHADDYKAAGVPMLPVVVSLERTVRSMTMYAVLLTLFTLVLVPVAELGWIYGITALVFGVAFVIGSARLGSEPSPKRSMRLFTFSITYVTAVFVALTVDVLLR
ncbi:MAG: heme o synthase [Actinomycetes bacterium]